jgi:hypothetical protein
MKELWRRTLSLFVALILAVAAMAAVPGCDRGEPIEAVGEVAEEAVEVTEEADE